MKRYLIAALALALVTASAVHAHTPTGDTDYMTLEHYASQRSYIRERAHELKVSKCRSHERLHFGRAASAVPAWHRSASIARWKRLREYARSRASACLPTSPEAIIRYVFPAATEGAAVSVASCESRLSPNAYNPSGAAGLFQLMPIWYAGKFDPFDALANTRAAYGLSSGGYNWTPWVCQP